VMLSRIGQGFVRDFVPMTLTESWALTVDSDEKARSHIHRTIDGGKTWQESLVSDQHLRRLFFLRKDMGWAVGDGTVLRYAVGH